MQNSLPAVGQSLPRGLVPQGTLRKALNDSTMSFFTPFYGLILAANRVALGNYSPKAPTESERAGITRTRLLKILIRYVFHVHCFPWKTLWTILGKGNEYRSIITLNFSQAVSCLLFRRLSHRCQLRCTWYRKLPSDREFPVMP